MNKIQWFEVCPYKVTYGMNRIILFIRNCSLIFKDRVVFLENKK